MYRKLQIFSLAATAAFSGSLFAQNPSGGGGVPQQSGPPPGVTQQPQMPAGAGQPMAVDPFADDKNFLKEATESSMIEVELGKLAQEKGSTPAVKNFGQRMVADHGKVGDVLQKYIQAAKLEPVDEMPRKGRKAHEKLAKLSGPEFDKEYAKMMAKDHKNEVKKYEKQSEDGKIPELKEFATKLLPIVQEHQKITEQLEASTKNGGAPSDSSGAR